MMDVPSDTQNCGPCKRTGHKKDGKLYCKQCKEYICDECRSQHAKFQDLREHEIVSLSSAIGSVSVQGASDEIFDCDTCKESGNKNEAHHYCEQCGNYLCTGCRDQHSKFKMLQNHKIVSLKPTHSDIQHASASGLLDGLQTHDISNITIKSSRKVKIELSGNEETCRITGCVFVPDEQLLLCDYNNTNIVLLDGSLAVQDNLKFDSRPWGMAVVDDSTAIVTFPNMRKMKYVSFKPKLCAGSTVSFDQECYGVAVGVNEIFVTCFEEKKGDVRILDIRGNEKRRITEDKFSPFKQPHYVSVDSIGQTLYVSDFHTDTVTCLNINGDTVYAYKDADLKSPLGLYVDKRGNVIVCSRDTDTLQVITAAGKKLKTLLISRDGIEKPLSIAFRPTDNTLVVSCVDRNELCFFKVVAE